MSHLELRIRGFAAVPGGASGRNSLGVHHQCSTTIGAHVCSVHLLIFRRSHDIEHVGSRAGMGLSSNDVSQKDAQVPVKVTLFRNTVFANDEVKMKSFEWTLLQDH